MRLEKLFMRALDRGAKIEFGVFQPGVMGIRLTFSDGKVAEQSAAIDLQFSDVLATAMLRKVALILEGEPNA